MKDDLKKCGLDRGLVKDRGDGRLKLWRKRNPPRPVRARTRGVNEKRESNIERQCNGLRASL
jgi:hypothetical protein